MAAPNPYVLFFDTADKLGGAGMALSATSATLQNGAFGSPSGLQILVMDWDQPALAAAYQCTIGGTALTSMTLLHGPNVVHAAGANVISALVPAHYASLVDGTGTTAATWTAYTPTFGGFTTPPTVIARYMVYGKTCTVSIYTLSAGTSTSSAFTISVPVNPANIANEQQALIPVTDNGVTKTGRVKTTQNNPNLVLYADAGTAGFTASGNKFSSFNFTFETA